MLVGASWGRGKSDILFDRGAGADAGQSNWEGS